MITAQLDSPWAERAGPTPGRYPKVEDDYTLESCRIVPCASDKVCVEVRCSHEVWEALVNDAEYGTAAVYWYQEDERKKRILRY